MNKRTKKTFDRNLFRDSDLHFCEENGIIPVCKEGEKLYVVSTQSTPVESLKALESKYQCGSVLSRTVSLEEFNRIFNELNMERLRCAYVRKDNYYIRGTGSVSWDTLKNMAQTGKLDPSTMIYVGKTCEWSKAVTIPDLFNKDTPSSRRFFWKFPTLQ